MLVQGRNRHTDAGSELLANAEKCAAPSWEAEPLTDLINAVVLLSNFVLVPATVYGCQLALGAPRA